MKQCPVSALYCPSPSASLHPTAQNPSSRATHAALSALLLPGGTDKTAAAEATSTRGNMKNWPSLPYRSGRSGCFTWDPLHIISRPCWPSTAVRIVKMPHLPLVVNVILLIVIVILGSASPLIFIQKATTLQQWECATLESNGCSTLCVWDHVQWATNYTCKEWQR